MNPGQLNYAISMLIARYLGKTPDYEAYNDVLGVLMAVSHEVYRRQVAPYEEFKLSVHGDIVGDKS